MSPERTQGRRSTQETEARAVLRTVLALRPCALASARAFRTALLGEGVPIAARCMSSSSENSSNTGAGLRGERRTGLYHTSTVLSVSAAAAANHAS